MDVAILTLNQGQCFKHLCGVSWPGAAAFHCDCWREGENSCCYCKWHTLYSKTVRAAFDEWGHQDEWKHACKKRSFPTHNDEEPPTVPKFSITLEAAFTVDKDSDGNRVLVDLLKRKEN